jgi:hypothetical protein
MTTHAEPYLECDACGAVERDLTKMAQLHDTCTHAGILRLRTVAIAETAPPPAAAAIRTAALPLL